MQIKSDHLLTRDEVAQMLSIKPQTLAVWATNKRYPLPYVKVGRAVRYKRLDVEDFIERNRVEVKSHYNVPETQFYS